MDDMRKEEMELVRRMLAGDEEAMNHFADGYFPPLYRFALSRLHGDRELAREVVQTTVCKALAKLGSYRGKAPLFTWLCACCRNEMGMYFRKKKRFPVAVELEEDSLASASSGPAAREPDPEERFARRQVRQQVHATLDLLPVHYARALEWKYLEHQPVGFIAGQLRLSLKAAESLLTRARRAFRESFEGLCQGSVASSGEGGADQTGEVVPFGGRGGSS